MAVAETILTPDVLVLGVGDAAVAAALAAARAGAATVLAGTLPGRRRFRAAASGVHVLSAEVWGVFPGPEVAATGAGVRYTLRPRRVVLSPGMFDSAVHVPGWRLPGCMAAGEVLDALRRGQRPAGPVVLAGDGGRLFDVAAALVRCRVPVAGVALASAEPAPGFLRRKGVPVWTGARIVRVEGDRRVAGLVMADAAGVRRIDAATCVLHWGEEQETGIARALGAVHEVVDGRLAVVADAAGGTSVPALFVAAGGNAGGTLAGRAAAGSLGLRTARRVAPWPRPTPPMPPPSLADLPDTTVVCPCEAVTAGQIRQAGASSLAWVKRATRAGMGQCRGRSCAAAIARLTGAATEADFAAPRNPLRPVPAAAILADAPEPADAAVALPPPTRWLTTAAAGLPGDADILVVGGGIVGLACALFLAREGRDVLLADRGEPGLAASSANAGSLHVQLVPYVYAAGSGGPMADALPLGPASVALWQEVARDANEGLGLRIEGGLVLAENEAQLDLLRSKAAFERSRSIPSEVIGPADLARLAPGLDRSFAGAAFCPLEGQGDPLRGTAALLLLARRAGVRIVPGLDVTGLAPDGAAWRVTTAAGVLRAGQVVNAAGAQAGRVGALAGVTVPMLALIQQVIATEPAPPMLRQLVAWTGRHLSLKQGEGGHLLIGGGWPGTIDPAGATHVTRSSLQGNLALAARALPGLREVRVTRAWTGLAPHLPRAPVISATAGMPGLWHAVSGNGYTLGPVIGRMLADAMLGRGTLPAAFAL